MEIHFRLLINCLLWVSLHSTVPSSQCLDLTTVIITASLSGHFVKKNTKVKDIDFNIRDAHNLEQDKPILYCNFSDVYCVL